MLGGDIHIRYFLYLQQTYTTQTHFHSIARGQHFEIPSDVTPFTRSPESILYKMSTTNATHGNTLILIANQELQLAFTYLHLHYV